MKTIQDPALYRKLSEPHADMKAAEAAISAFFDDLRVAREKHRIPEMTILALANYLRDGVEATALWSQHSGDSTKALPILAQAYGAAMEENQFLMESLATPRKRK